MKLALTLSLTCAACYGAPDSMAVTDPPARAKGSTSALRVPASCPIYAPGDYDTDTPEAPFGAPLAFGCGVDSAGATYGLQTGDAGPTVPSLQILPGGVELGLYYQFVDEVADQPFDPSALVGSAGLVTAYAGPYNLNGAVCCPEDPPETRIPVAVVAADSHGMLLSLGTFDTTTPLQVYTTMWTARLFPNLTFDSPVGGDARFYVNAPPVACAWYGSDGSCLEWATD